MKIKNLQLKDFYGATVWSYTRVSTKEQFMNNGSIETQVNRIKTLPKKMHFILQKSLMQNMKVQKNQYSKYA